MSAPTVTSPAQESPRDQHEQDVESKEAYQYWGYLFKPDKTGTDTLKGLLRGLKDVMLKQYEPSDSPDLTPTQLASFYRELNGNYDQLFLGTPSESIAFIYKSLGCLHSLQPLSHSTAFTDPTVPALKTEGWIMWQTIQLLLGPEEHSSFLMEAVQRWDVKDPATGQTLPKILPRQCFPMEPDKHMVAWYEGVSERLRREAEEEERQRDMEAQQQEVRRLHARKDDVDDDEASLDSRGPALAYFRNPLYRHVDGRPSIVRQNSKRPQLSPKPTGVMGKGKEAATTVGHVIRNIGSPHLWDGRGSSKSHSGERHRRRTSLPDNRHHHHGEPGQSAGYFPAVSPAHDKHRRRRDGQTAERPPTGSSGDDDFRDEGTPVNSPPLRAHRQNHRHSSSDERDATLRHSRSHEPTPSQKEYPDYFHGFDDPSSRSSTAYESTSPAPTPNGIGPAFGPSASPLFASHVAKQPQPSRPHSDVYGAPPRMNPGVRRAQERPYSHSRSPDPSQRRGDDRDSRRYESRDRRSRHDRSPDRGYNEGPPPLHQPGFPPSGGDPGRRGSGSTMVPSDSRDRRSGRRSGSDISYNGPDDRDRHRRSGDGGSGRPKQTRFAAETGVDGRRYPDQAPWR